MVRVLTSSFSTVGAEEVSRLEAARAGTDHLAIGVIPDGGRRADHRPTIEDRVALLGALRCVDTAVVYDAVNAAALDELVRGAPVGHLHGTRRSVGTTSAGSHTRRPPRSDAERERSHAG